MDLDPHGPPYRVEQGGPRRLFDEVTDAYRWWLQVGASPVGQWLISVDSRNQPIVLDPPA